jgi:hypothetical protein
MAKQYLGEGGKLGKWFVLFMKTGLEALVV